MPDGRQHQRDEKCLEVFSLLSEYLDLELPPDARRQIESHLRGCAPCIEFVESLRSTIGMCRRFAPSEVPEPIKDNAKRQLEEAYRKMLAARDARG